MSEMRSRPQLPLGEAVDWLAAQAPAPLTLSGRYALLRPVDPTRDARPLYAVSHPPDGDPEIWTYLHTGPYASVEDFREMLVTAQGEQDALYFTIASTSDERPAGLAAYLRITPQSGAIELGNIWFGPSLRRTSAATEAIYLLARHAFEELGYRRVEWKCNSLNAASRRAAERLGFSFEGVFRKHQVVKGRNRDTAWYAITDDDWPVIASALRAWLAPSNFDADGRQRRSLVELRDDADAA